MLSFYNTFKSSAIVMLSSLCILSMSSCGSDDEDEEDDPEIPENPSGNNGTTTAKIKIGTPYYGDLMEYNPVASQDLHYSVFDNYNFVLIFKSASKCEISMSGTQWKYTGYYGGDTYKEQQISETTKSTTYSISGSTIYVDDYDPQYQLTKGIEWSGTITGYGSIIHNGNQDIVFSSVNK